MIDADAVSIGSGRHRLLVTDRSIGSRLDTDEERTIDTADIVDSPDTGDGRQ